MYRHYQALLLELGYRQYSNKGRGLNMSKKVNFFTVNLFEAMSSTEKDYKMIKDLLVSIIEENAKDVGNFKVIDLTRDNDLHYVADIFAYKDQKLFMRLSNQKPAGGYLRRNYTTNIPAGVLGTSSDDKEGIEVYTYALLDYESGIFSIVNQQSAPNYKIINYFFSKYKAEYYMDFTAIPNPDGISRIYEAKEPRISQIEIEVPVPSAEVLEQLFGWNAKDILDVQGHGLKATMRLSGMERRMITDTEEESKGIIDCIKKKKIDYNKAKVRAKAEGVKTRDYSFFDENFSYPIEITSYCIINGEKHYHTADELISIYREHLQMAYNENELLLKAISNR